MTVGTTTELEDGIVSENGDQSRHVPDVNTTGSDGEHTGIEPQSDRRSCHGCDLLGRRIRATGRCSRGWSGDHPLVSDHGTGVKLVTTGQTQTLGKNAEVYAVLGMTVNRVHGTVNVQQHAVLAAPLR